MFDFIHPTPFSVTKEQMIEEAMAACPSEAPIDRTHAAVWGLVQYVKFNPGTLHFFNADTGLGKTTGFQLAIKACWDAFWRDLPVLIMVPTKHDAEKMYLAMEALEEGCAGVWTETHDPQSAVHDEHFTPTHSFTKHEAAAKKCLVVTHNAGKCCEEWVGRRDIVFVDEDPPPVSHERFDPWMFTKARDEEAERGGRFDLFQEAHEWAEGQCEAGIRPLEIPEWVGAMLEVEAVTEAGKSLQRLAKAINDGRAFADRVKATTWHTYNYDLPFQDRMIIFSATAQYEGYQFGSDNQFVTDLLPKVDYSNVTFRFGEWPEGVSKYHRRIMEDRAQRELFFSFLHEWIGWADEKTLIVCPKAFRSDLSTMFPMAKVTNYGRDVGSNDYRDCDVVYVVSEHHVPKNTHRARYLGHSSEGRLSEDTLRPLENTRGKLMLELEDAHHSVHLKQMIARSNIRNVDASGQAGKATIHCLVDEERYARLLPRLFPNAKLEFPEARQASAGGSGTTTVLAKCIRYLSAVPDSKTFVASTELKEQGIWVKGKRKNATLEASSRELAGIGWVFVKGTGKGNPNGFRRLEEGR